LSKSWEDFKKTFPWKDMTVGFLVPKAILFIGISWHMIFAGAAVAMAWSLAVCAITFIRARKVNIFAVCAVVLILARVVVILVSKSPALYLFAQALECALYAAAFFISLVFPRSIIQMFAEESGVRIPEKIRVSTYYRKAWQIITAVWAGTYLCVAVGLVLLKLGSLKSVAVIDMLASWPITAILVAFTVIFPRRYWTEKLGDFET
jgi:intracellular septation protein A